MSNLMDTASRATSPLPAPGSTASTLLAHALPAPRPASGGARGPQRCIAVRCFQARRLPDLGDDRRASVRVRRFLTVMPA